MSSSSSVDGALALLLSIVGFAGARWWWRRLHAPPPSDEPVPGALEALAEHLALEGVYPDSNQLECKRDGFRITLTALAGARYRVRLDTEGRLPAWLHVVPRRPGASPPPGTTETHDPFLDRAFWVVGAPRAVAAVLRHPIRAQLLALRSITVRPGTIESQCTASRLLHVQRWFTNVVDIALALTDVPDDIDRALLTGFREDSHPRVRRHMLRLLYEPTVSDELRTEAMSAGLNDPDPDVRCFAALRHPGPEAVAELQGLAGGYEIPDNIRLAALHGLLKRKSGTSLVPLLIEAAAAGPESRLSRRAMSWAIGYGGADALKKIVAKPRLPLAMLSHAMDIAERLAAKDVAPELLAMLDWAGASDERRRLAIAGLAAVGTVDAIPRLKQVTQRDAPLAGAARAAIARIQSRVEGDPGALSFVEADRGQLAVVEAGGLGVASDEGP